MAEELNRREAARLGAAATTGLLLAGGLAPRVEGAEQRPMPHGLILGPGGIVLDVPENREFLEGLEKAPDLKPQELMGIAAALSQNEALRPVALHLFADAVQMFVESPLANRAVEQIARAPVEFSIFGDIWRAIKDALGDLAGGHGRSSGTCRRRCYALILAEKCGDRPWRVIGVCFGFRF